MSLQQTNEVGKNRLCWGREAELEMQPTVTGVGGGCSGQESMSLLSKVGRVVCSSLELSKALLRNKHDHPGSEQQQDI